MNAKVIILIAAATFGIGAGTTNNTQAAQLNGACEQQCAIDNAQCIADGFRRLVCANIYRSCLAQCSFGGN
jgi:hypothetical protein